eukprot:scaffold36278_cov134-Isochrysis_galbana.AAC.3
MGITLGTWDMFYGSLGSRLRPSSRRSTWSSQADRSVCPSTTCSNYLGIRWRILALGAPCARKVGQPRLKPAKRHQPLLKAEILVFLTVACRPRRAGHRSLTLVCVEGKAVERN